MLTFLKVVMVAVASSALSTLCTHPMYQFFSNPQLGMQSQTELETVRPAPEKQL